MHVCKLLMDLEELIFDKDALRKLLSTMEAREAFRDYCTSLMLSNLLRVSITQQTHANHETIIMYC